MSQDTEFLPPLARERVDELREHTGAEPAVTRTETGWRVSLTSGRVELVMEWRRRSPRSSEWKYHSTLTVDGERRPLAKDIDEFVWVWENPDQTHVPLVAARRLAQRPVAHVPVLGEPLPVVPAAVEAVYLKNRAALPAENGSAQLGFSDGRWQMLFTLRTAAGEVVEVYTSFGPDEHGHYPADVDTTVESLFVLEGKDCTSLIGELDLKALGLAAVSPEPSRGWPGKARQAAGGSGRMRWRCGVRR